MKFKFEYDDSGLKKELEKFEKQASDLSKGHETTLDNILNNDFIAKYTDFTDFDTFIENSPLKGHTSETLSEVSDESLDKFASTHSQFDNWDDLYTRAGEEYIAKYLGF